MGGSIPMNIARMSSSGNTSVTAVMPPISEENVFQSRLTLWMSSGLVIDQYPASFGYSAILSVQCTGHWPRSCLKTSCGGPSSQNSRSPSWMSSSLRSVVDMPLLKSLCCGIAQA